MLDRRYALKVKIKSLAAEAKIIRFEEKKSLNTFKRADLASHRRGIVREVARHTLLAYGFIRGLKYSQIEFKCFTQPDWSKVEAMIQKYGVKQGPEESFNECLVRKKDLEVKFQEWKKDCVVVDTAAA